VATQNLVNLEKVSKSYGREPLLNSVSLGISARQRIGVVGRNGAGKSTLLKVLTGLEMPDSGRVTRRSGLQQGLMSQRDVFDGRQTIRQLVLGDQLDHEWAGDSRSRTVLGELLGGYGDQILERALGSLSGGERRRVDLARLLVQNLDLLILDEPTNHLDIEAISWLAEFLKQRRELALVVVTHDRWLLDDLARETWEVVDGGVERYEGGYSAFVLAKAERGRQSKSAEQRRNNLVRKELAWLRRGPPARTSKSKFRVDVANELIAREPPARNNAELLSFANSRLGKTVWELHDVSLEVGDRLLVDRVTWNIGPGARIAIVGVNGAGKTSLVRMLLGQLRPESGKIVRGKTIKTAYLSQHLEELDPQWRVLEAVEQVAQRVKIAKGRELTAAQLCERLGFDPESQWTPVGDLSGGERRRLQLTRLLMSEPNVLVLDEPTNDFDVETLTALEDLLDSFGGTLLIITHDRYFAERVCDNFVGLVGDGTVRDLPGGVEQYLKLLGGQVTAAFQTGQLEQAQTSGREAVADKATRDSGQTRSALEQQLRKKMGRAERQIKRAEAEEVKLHESLLTNAADFELVSELDAKLRAVQADREAAEEMWLAAVEEMEG
jgi:ATP-binding cassette subfamily F protein uup